jgi:hypothetical protein
MSEKVRLVLEIERNDKGDLKTSHRFLSPEDEKIAQGWESGGLVQVAHALFVEALRREAYTMLITQLSKDPDLEKASAGDLNSNIRAHWSKLLEQMAPGASREALRMLRLP